MVKFIEKATKEFEQNGRSKLFVAMENKIINSGKPMQMYFFARYAKGADIKRLQKVFIKMATLEQCYYFAKFVQGAQIRPFITKSFKVDDKFWTEKLINLAHTNGSFDAISDLVMDFVPETKKGVFARKGFDSNDLIEEAQKEYKQYGRSPYFVELEKYCLHSNVPADMNLFAQHIEDVNVRDFERAAILKGDPFTMFIVVTEIRGGNAKLMRDGLEMAKHDYVEIERTDGNRINQKLQLLLKIKNEKNPVERKLLMEMYKRLPTIPEYIAIINNRYLPRVDYEIRKQGIQK